MSDEDKSPRPTVPKDIGRFALEPLNHAIAAGTRQALAMGIPSNNVLDLHINNLASLIAMVEPAEARAETLKDIIRALPGLVRQHLDLRYTSPGGIKLPGTSI